MTRQTNRNSRDMAQTGERALNKNNAETFPEEGTDETLLKPQPQSARPLTEAETLSATRQAISRFPHK